MLNLISSADLLLSMVNSQSRNSLILIGLAAFAGGVLMMIRHKRDIDNIYRKVTDRHVLRFEQRKFRRRSLASTMITVMGIMMTSLYWARDPYAFASLISVVLILLLAVMFIACLDLMSVSLHTVTKDDEGAREKLVKEYVRQRNKLQENAEDNEVGGD